MVTNEFHGLTARAISVLERAGILSKEDARKALSSDPYSIFRVGGCGKITMKEIADWSGITKRRVVYINKRVTSSWGW